MKQIERALHDIEGSYFLFGPRGTGKSTWLTERFPKAQIISLLDPAVRRELRAYPERLRNYIQAKPDRLTVVIDEIQRAPEVLDVVHQLMDEKAPYRFIMTGSSARKLKRNANADLLGGRAVKRMCHPFLARELGDSFDLDEALRYGMIPLVRFPKSGTSASVLKTYLDLYIEEELITEGVIRKVDSFFRFLEVASFSHASVLSASEIAREAEVKRSTVDTYFEILEEMLIISRLPVFSKRAKRRLVGHDKIYFFDAGVFRTLRPRGPLDRATEIEGACLEGLVYQQLRAWNDYLDEPNRLYFWRTRNGVEVDFVIYGPKTFRAIEVKNSMRVDRSDASGLEAFHADYPEAELTLLYRGERSQRITDNVTAVPVSEFLVGL